MQIEELIKIAKEKVKSFNPAELMNAGFMPMDGSYFPAIYYPPITMYPPAGENEIFSNFKYNSENPMSIYIHIPFCPRRCKYCHWVVSIGDSEADMNYYLDNLVKEADLYKKRFGIKHLAPRSVLIGGGTPSMLSYIQIKKLFDSLINKFDLSKCRQITCEVEPTTIIGNAGMERLKVMKANGVNRISLGVQSFNDEVLKMMGRAHTSEDAKKAVKQIKNAGFESLSVDLIYGHPGSTLEKWADTLKTAFLLDIDACQQYRLRIVPHGGRTGAVKNLFDKTPEVFPDMEEIYKMKEFGILFATQNGFKETSRRVFARKARDNSDYLKDHTDRLYDILGLGVSSWSNIQGRLFINTVESLEKYYSYIEKGRLPVEKGKVRPADEEQRWAVVLPLKHFGVSKSLYKKITGTAINDIFKRKIEILKSFGLIEENNERLLLTEKGGFFADEVCIQFYHPDYIPFPKSEYAKGDLNPYSNFA